MTKTIKKLKYILIICSLLKTVNVLAMDEKETHPLTPPTRTHVALELERIEPIARAEVPFYKRPKVWLGIIGTTAAVGAIGVGIYSIVMKLQHHHEHDFPHIPVPCNATIPGLDLCKAFYDLRGELSLFDCSVEDIMHTVSNTSCAIVDGIRNNSLVETLCCLQDNLKDNIPNTLTVQENIYNFYDFFRTGMSRYLLYKKS